MIFLSHGPNPETQLSEHLSYVAKTARQLATASKFPCPDIAFYAGLFHDLGKLNPYYQKMFSGIPKETAAQTYDDFHAPFSGWIAKHLLKKNKWDLSKQEQRRVCMLIYGHHTQMRKDPGNFSFTKEKGSRTIDILCDNWKIFVSNIENTIPFDSVNFDVDLDIHRFKFKKSLDLDQNENPLEAFLQCGYFFSCLLQADRSSFSNFVIKELDDSFSLDITKLEKHNSALGGYRKDFQDEVLRNIDTSKPIHVINAPTGAGKTKAFLSLIEKYKPKRVFYFSPLLALTDDISEKIESITSNPEQILLYNHIFSGSLKKHHASMHDKEINTQNDESNNEQSWNFDHEAFNEKFIITTTVRLLMTIYSNYHKDKIKLASFRNSLLIIDEVQTLPKPLLKNLMSILKMMSEMMYTKTLLVSATIPYELQDLPIVSMPKDTIEKYLKEKNRTVTLKKELEVNQIRPNSLVMLNTRKNAVISWNKLSQQIKNIHYISSGITKKQRDEILSAIKSKNEPLELQNKKPVLVTTQVLEAGVDISFTTIWRQLAPLDNIIQVLGRLDRESSNKKDAMAYIFDIENENHKPYSSLEYRITKKMLQEIANPETSTSKIYEILDDYYKRIHDEDKIQSQTEETLDHYLNNLDFENIWKSVRDLTGNQIYEDVYIPDISEWNICKRDLLSDSKIKHKIYEKKKASLPRSARQLLEYWDKELYEKNILLPKKDRLDDIYDKDLGLDKWIIIE